MPPFERLPTLLRLDFGIFRAELGATATARSCSHLSRSRCCCCCRPLLRRLREEEGWKTRRPEFNLYLGHERPLFHQLGTPRPGVVAFWFTSEGRGLGPAGKTGSDRARRLDHVGPNQSDQSKSTNFNILFFNIL